MSIHAVSPEFGVHFSSTAFFGSGSFAHAEGGAAGAAGAAAGACVWAYEMSYDDTLKKRPSTIPKARAKSPAREDFINVMVLLLSVLFAVRVIKEPRRRSRRCGCARRFPDGRRSVCRRRSVRSWRHP